VARKAYISLLRSSLLVKFVVHRKRTLLRADFLRVMKIDGEQGQGKPVNW
jgi:hypothetical protein